MPSQTLKLNYFHPTLSLHQAILGYIGPSFAESVKLPVIYKSARDTPYRARNIQMQFTLPLCLFLSLASAYRYVVDKDTKVYAKDAQDVCYDNDLNSGRVQSHDLGLIAKMMEKRNLNSLWIRSINGRTYADYYLAIDLIDKSAAKTWYETNPVNHLAYSTRHCTDEDYCAVVKKVKKYHHGKSNHTKKYPLCLMGSNDSRNDDIDSLEYKKHKKTSHYGKGKSSRYGKRHY